MINKFSPGRFPETRLLFIWPKEYYLACKTKLHKIYDKKVEGFRFRSKFDWYEKEEKYIKFLLKTTCYSKSIYDFSC